MLAELTREERRAGGYGLQSVPGPKTRLAVIEAAFTRLKAACEAAKVTDAQHEALYLYANGWPDHGIARYQGVSEQCARDRVKAGLRLLEDEFPDPKRALPEYPRVDILRCMKSRPDPEPDPEQAPPGPGEVTALHARPFGLVPADLRDAHPDSPAGRAGYYERLLLRLRQITPTARVFPHVAEVPGVRRPATQERRKSRKERREDKRRQAGS